MAHGILHVPNTLTTRKLLNRTGNPNDCRHRAYRRAPTFACTNKTKTSHLFILSNLLVVKVRSYSDSEQRITSKKNYPECTLEFAKHSQTQNTKS